MLPSDTTRSSGYSGDECRAGSTCSVACGPSEPMANRNNKLRGLAPKGESKMIRLEKEKRISEFSLAKPGVDWLRQYRVGTSDVQLLSEVFDTIEHGENSTHGPSREAFDRWILSFQDQSHRFTSPILVCELQYNELLQVKHVSSSTISSIFKYNGLFLSSTNRSAMRLRFRILYDQLDAVSSYNVFASSESILGKPSSLPT